MDIIAIPPMTPPAIAPAWPLECEGLEDGVEDALAVDVDTPDVYTPEGPKIAPGPYSGPSISSVGERPERGALERKGEIGATMLTTCLTRFVRVPIVLVLERVMITVP